MAYSEDMKRFAFKFIYQNILLKKKYRRNRKIGMKIIGNNRKIIMKLLIKFTFQ